MSSRRGNENNEPDRSLKDRAMDKIDVRAELVRLEQMIEVLRVDYEQFFMGMRPHAPDSLHADVKKLIRRLIKAPFKNSQMAFALRTLENRFHTYNNYWARVNREREEGTYRRDVFKANLRERLSTEAAQLQTVAGKANKSMQELFNAYKGALEKQTGNAQNLDFDRFKTSLAKRAKDFQNKHGDKKISFRVVVKQGKVSLQAKVKGE